jgi:anionic cell wall polymer biosynthesis LytR-Cps2A-Psr (LCP) family protein
MVGVRIDVPNPGSGRGAPEGPEIALSPGPQKLDGAQALVYLQGRDLRDAAEILKRQQTFLYTMFGQALSVSTLLASPDTFVKLSDNVETDMRWIQEAQLAARVLKLKGEDETPKMNVLNDP